MNLVQSMFKALFDTCSSDSQNVNLKQIIEYLNSTINTNHVSFLLTFLSFYEC
jgi:hypothetical protein